MSAAAATRVGWCPGALRPMMTGDGLLVRVKPRGMALPVECAIGIAAAAARHGNGLLDLTARANLQIRGVAESSLPALTAELDAMGLLDADPGAEARRNVIASPLMGLDPSAAFDVRPAVAALEAALAGAAGLDALPSKFGFAVSDGGATALDGVSADVRFDATPDGRFAVRLDGGGGATISCMASEVPELALRLARAFVAAAAADPGLHRMSDLVVAVGAAEVAARIDAEPARPVAFSTTPRMVAFLRVAEEDLPPTRCGSSSAERRRGTGRSPVEEAGRAPPPTSPRPRLVGRFDIPGVPGALGVVAPFGRLGAAQLDALAGGAARAGAGELRVTPWRAFLVPGPAPAALDRLAADCAAVGLVVDPLDPRLRVAACAGAPGCRRATTPVLEDAAALAPLLGPGGGVALHVSGCAKGCAHPGPAPLTLVASTGRYAVVSDGTASDLPVVYGLAAGEARRLLRTILSLDGRP